MSRDGSDSGVRRRRETNARGLHLRRDSSAFQACWTFPFVFIVFLLFFVPSPSFTQQDPDNIDVSLFRKINNGRSPFLSRLFDVNNGTVYPAAILAPVGFFSSGLIRNRHHEIETSFLLSITELVSFGTSYGLKQVVKRNRPSLTLSNVHLLGGRSESYSFPSGHATGAFAIATSLSLRYPNVYVYVPLHLWALLVSYGRVYAGLHYPSDVLVGAAIGSGTAFLVHSLEEDLLEFGRKLFGRPAEGEQELRKVGLSIAPVDAGWVLHLTYRF